MVVDLDGSYYHGDKYDYDGLHSKEEYDERRCLSVSDNIKLYIIQENNFINGFKEMMKIILSNYDEYIDNLFNEYRGMSFPYPHYSNDELKSSFHKLCIMNCDDKYHKNISLNNREGDRIINHFHHSIWHAHVKDRISPYDAWYNDDLLRKCIINRTLYQSTLNPNKILQGFNISKIATKVSVFSAGRAKLLIYKYLNEYNEIFDPFSGFSGRMLGTMSLGKHYIGQDISDMHIKESNDIINYFKFDTYLSCKDIFDSYGEYECLFTCPPYSDKEIWLDNNNDPSSCDEWIDICIKHFRCKKYLFVVDNTNKYQDNIVDIIINKSHFSKNNEYVILIDRLIDRED